MTLGVILLAGGVGTRMKAKDPKQYLLLQGKPLIHYSFELFLSMPEVAEIIVVCQPEYRNLFAAKTEKIVHFALPGKRRQDSVQNGFDALTTKTSLTCIHDGVRPFVTLPIVHRVMKAAESHGASAAGMPVKFTVKQCCKEGFVQNTPDRSMIWEIQTPQIIQTKLLKKGLAHAAQEQSEVTDDVAFIELLGLPVKIVEGAHSNIKITTPEDLSWSESLLLQNKVSSGV